MSGSFYRMTSPTPRSVPQSRWHASRDAADILDDMAENLSAMTEARTMLAKEAWNDFIQGFHRVRRDNPPEGVTAQTIAEAMRLLGLEKK